MSLWLVFFFVFFGRMHRNGADLRSLYLTLVCRHPSSDTVLLSVFMLEIKWQTKAKKCESLTNSCLLTNECITEDSQLRISLIRAPERTERQESGPFCLFYPPISAVLSSSQILITPDKFSCGMYILAQWLAATPTR